MTQVEHLDLHKMETGQAEPEPGPAFFCVILYESFNIEFQNVMLKLLNQTLDFSSPAMQVITNEFPTAGGVGNSNNMVDELTLEKICKRFGLTSKGLPYVIFFSDLNRQDFNQFCFRNADLKTVDNFFTHIMDSAAKFRYQQMNFIKLMMMTREMFPQLKTESAYVFNELPTLSQRICIIENQGGSYQLDAKARYAQRHSSNCREKCREMAKFLWIKEPTITITDMARKDEISEICKKLNDDLYTEDTVKNWIKDVCPNRRPGRRPKD